MSENHAVELQFIDEQTINDIRFGIPEFGDDIIAFLITAYELMKRYIGFRTEQKSVTRYPEAVAYCIREAITRPLKSASVLSVGARNKYDISDEATKVAQQCHLYKNSLKKIDDNSQTYRSNLFESIKRMEAANNFVSLNRMAKVTNYLKHHNIIREENNNSAGDSKLIETYIEALNSSNNSLHKTISSSQLHSLWQDCIWLHKEVSRRIRARLEC